MKERGVLGREARCLVVFHGSWEVDDAKRDAGENWLRLERERETDR